MRDLAVGHGSYIASARYHKAEKTRHSVSKEEPWVSKREKGFIVPPFSENQMAQLHSVIGKMIGCWGRVDSSRWVPL